MKLRSESLSQGDLVKISKLCALDWELEKADTKYKRNRDMERH
jgi:hypothetical protein